MLQHLRWSSLVIDYSIQSILNSKLFLVWPVAIIVYLSTTRSTIFAPKCNNDQSCLNKLKHDSANKSCLKFSEDNIKGFLSLKIQPFQKSFLQLQVAIQKAIEVESKVTDHFHLILSHIERYEILLISNMGNLFLIIEQFM